MKRFGLSSLMLGVCAALVMLAACGRTQPQIGAPGALSQNVAMVAK